MTSSVISSAVDSEAGRISMLIPPARMSAEPNALGNLGGVSACGRRDVPVGTSPRHSTFGARRFVTLAQHLIIAFPERAGSKEAPGLGCSEAYARQIPGQKLGNLPHAISRAAQPARSNE